MFQSIESRLHRIKPGLALAPSPEASAAEAASGTGLAGYLDSIAIDASPVPQPWRSLAEPWQREFYGTLVPLVERAAGYRRPPGPRCCFTCLPRGHAKTSAVAQLVAWALAYARRPVGVVAAAADRDQSAILAERLERESGCNPWLAAKLKRHNFSVDGPTGHLEILASDAPTASGLHPDLIVCDEITWWRRRDLFDVLFSGRNKKPHLAFVILTNAGICGTWQHDLWLSANRDVRQWTTFSTAGSVASWLDLEAIAADRKLLPDCLGRRLYDNEWVSESGSFLTRQQIEACVNPSWSPQRQSVSGHEYVLSMDAGITYDRAVAAVMHLDHATDTVVLDLMHVHQGTPTARTEIALMQRWADDAIRDFRICELIADPYQIETVCQRTEEASVKVERFSAQWASQHAASENLRTLVVNGKLRLYPRAGLLRLPDGRDEDMVDEMAALEIEQTSGTRWRFQHLPGKHDDRTVALAMGALACVRRPLKASPRVIVVGG